MNKLIKVLFCTASIAMMMVSAQAAGKTQTDLDSAAAYGMTHSMYMQRQKGDNLVFSPYSMQQMFSLIRDNTKDKKAIEELRPFVVKKIRTETLRNTKSGSLILLNKNLASARTGESKDDIRLVAYPNEALKEKEAFQERILDSVIDTEAPTGDLTFLTAAHYFAEWQTKFDKKLTQNRDFTLETGTVIKTPTMKKHFEYGTGKLTNDYDMMMVPGNNKSQVYFIKPNKDAQEVSLHLDKIISDYDQHIGTVQDIIFEVPKISLKNKLDLNNLLKQMGFKSFYDGNLHFQSITGDAPYVLDKAQQTATLDINEDYAEGKALTEMSFRLTSVMEPKPVYTIKMDKPYFIVIKDKTMTGVSRVVFTAFVANPKG